MRATPLGEYAWILRDLPRPAYECVELLSQAQIPNLEDAVASYDSVGVYVSEGELDLSLLESALLGDPPRRLHRSHRIPVCYEVGEDLVEVADQLGLGVGDLIELHSEPEYRCYAVGFCPGFPYLGYLNQAISEMPRLPNPRARVNPGAVAIAGRQTGIYPLARPGGWRILGQTPLTIVDEADGYFPITSGDKVKFYPIDVSEFDRLKGERL